MGNCFSSNEEKEARERSYAIDKQLEEDSRKFKKECKILLLGEYIQFGSRGCAEEDWTGARNGLG